MKDVLDVLVSSGALLLIVAILTESVTEVIKSIFPKGSIQDKVTYGVSVLVGLVLAFAFHLNIFGLNGFGEYVSIVFAGLIASRGANYVNGFLKKFDILR